VKKGQTIIIIAILILLAGGIIVSNIHNNANIALDEEAALEIGRALLLDRFKNGLDSNSLFRAISKEETWRIENITNIDIENSMTITAGGVYYVLIRKSDCKIIEVGIDD